MLIPVRLTERRTRASHIFDRVAAGETIAVEYRGRIVAAVQSWVGEAHAHPHRCATKVIVMKRTAHHRVGTARARERLAG